MALIVSGEDDEDMEEGCFCLRRQRLTSIVSGVDDEVAGDSNLVGVWDVEEARNLQVYENMFNLTTLQTKTPQLYAPATRTSSSQTAQSGIADTTTNREAAAIWAAVADWHHTI